MKSCSSRARKPRRRRRGDCTYSRDSKYTTFTSRSSTAAATACRNCCRCELDSAAPDSISRPIIAAFFLPTRRRSDSLASPHPPHESHPFSTDVHLPEQSLAPARKGRTVPVPTASDGPDAVPRSARPVNQDRTFADVWTRSIAFVSGAGVAFESTPARRRTRRRRRSRGPPSHRYGDHDSRYAANDVPSSHAHAAVGSEAVERDARECDSEVWESGGDDGVRGRNWGRRVADE